MAQQLLAGVRCGSDVEDVPDTVRRSAIRVYGMPTYVYGESNRVLRDLSGVKAESLLRPFIAILQMALMRSPKVGDTFYYGGLLPTVALGDPNGPMLLRGLTSTSRSEGIAFAFLRKVTPTAELSRVPLGAKAPPRRPLKHLLCRRCC
jgi:hypothetical protein